MTLTPEKANWIDLINESVHTSDEVDIGHINTISRDFIVAKRDLINVQYYYVDCGNAQ
jgi:hypothetical protein